MPIHFQFLVYLIATVLAAVFYYYASSKKSPPSIPNNSDWQGDQDVDLNQGVWAIFRAHNPHWIQNVHELIDKDGKLHIQGKFVGRSGRCSLVTIAGESLEAEREGLLGPINYFSAGRLVGRFIIPPTSLSNSPKHIEIEGRKIDQLHKSEGIFQGPLLFLDNGVLLAKIRPLSRYRHAAEAMAIRKDLPASLKMILFHVSRLER
ncbi:MAG: hypothetical protein DCC75_03525 [Proteobacteria bacterium]|nr:MAG: hypothetical protein DCC75_03525 [Pseudomonadota bacterium]